jgi:hypothetical protein
VSRLLDCMIVSRWAVDAATEDDRPIPRPKAASIDLLLVPWVERWDPPDADSFYPDPPEFLKADHLAVLCVAGGDVAVTSHHWEAVISAWRGARGGGST